MVNPLRGELWWVRLDPTVGSEIAKTRPCVVLSRDSVSRWRRTVVIVPISSSPKPQPGLLIPVFCEERWGVAVLDQIRAVAKERFGNRIGRLTDKELYDIGFSLRDMLNLP